MACRAVAVLVALCAFVPFHAAAQGAPDVVRYVDVPLQDWLPFWVAQQEGLGKRYNIELKAVPITGGTQTAEFAASGNADIATVAATLCLLAVKQGLVPDRIALVAPVGSSADPQHPFAGIIASDAVKTWKDLEGKTVAVHSVRSLFYLALVTRLAREGVDVKKINFVEVPLPQQVAALKAGRVDAIMVGTDFAARAAADHVGHLLDWVIGKPPFDQYNLAMLVANRAFADGKPAVLENFLKTYMTAVKWIVDHPQQAKEVAAAKLGFKDPVIAKGFLLENWDPTLTPNAGSQALDVEVMKGQGLISEPIDLGKYLTRMDLVADARRAALGN
jgi:ABC-type nitrate/sulfonate/bicarbonate transport system substrate-binding protein